MTARKKPAKRAVGYVRVSSAGQEDGTSLRTQRERISVYAEAQGLELVDVVSEAASGAVRGGAELSIDHRPRLLALVDRAERGEYDVLLVARFDRLSRDHATFIILERRLKRHGVEICSAAEANGDSAQDRFFRSVIEAVAELERTTILDRVRAGKSARKREGRRAHGAVPFGFLSVKADGGGRTLEPVDEAAAVVRRIFDDVLAGDRPGKIARALNAEEVPGPRGKGWSGVAVRRIIENPVYAGEMHGKKRAHPAIVSKRVWNAAAAALAKQRRA